MAKDPTALSGKIRIPQPAHPERRQQPLPWHRPKSPEEDPDAPSRLTAILASPSYRLAEQDLAFLERDETRGVRLQIEYLKPETLLQGHAIRDTVVVYGSTRIPEPAAARRSAEALRQALETEPSNGGPARGPRLCQESAISEHDAAGTLAEKSYRARGDVHRQGKQRRVEDERHRPMGG